VPYYPIVNLASIEPQDSDGGAKAQLLTLRSEDGVIFPVFTSLDRFWAFVDKYYAGDDSAQPSTFPLTPFRLAEMVGPTSQGVEIDALIFNPVVVSAGEWRSTVKSIPVAEYCRFMAEIRPDLEKLTQEAEAEFCHLPDSESFKKSLEWAEPYIQEAVDNARARIEEWQD
jgi:SseB protein N-terminal domain